MNGSTRKPTIHLSLVKDKAQGRFGKFLSLEVLSPEQTERVKRYQRLIAPSGVLVGVVLGGPEWDLRPLILQRGIMTITRMFSPAVRESASLSDALKSYIFQIESLFPGAQQLVCGSAEGYVWVSRRYFNQLLTDPNLILPLQERITLLGRLITELQRLHEHGKVHGHICPSNIAYEGGAFVLLDHGLQILDPELHRPETLAPELTRSVAAKENATPATDLYGLGLITKQLLGGALGTEYGNLIEVLLLQDPKLRPSLSEIRKHFISDLATTNEPPVASHNKAPASKEGTTPAPLSFDGASLLQWLYWLGGAGALIALLFALRSTWYGSPELDEKIERYWSSNQPALMQQVLVLALEGDDTIAEYVVEQAGAQSSHPGIQSAVFASALNPLWIDELGPREYRALIALGMGPLVPAQYRSAPQFDALHPGVVLAVVGQMSIEDGFAAFQGVSMRRFSKLPEPYASAFLAIERLGVKSLADSTAQALCHILLGNVSPAIMGAYLKEQDPPDVIAGKLEVLIPLLELDNGMGEKLLQSLANSNRYEGFFSWFDRDPLGRWNDTGPREKLLMFTGVLPELSLALEQLVDLLKFPRNSIRERVGRLLEGQVSSAVKLLLPLLSSPESKLTRAQTVLLVTALQVENASVLPYVTQWFQTSPDPLTVAKILALWRSPQPVDPFSIEAARYLIPKDLKLSVSHLRVLAEHPEPLARAFAYSKLSSSNAEQRGLLEKAAAQETSQRLREELLSRLQGSPES